MFSLKLKKQLLRTSGTLSFNETWLVLYWFKVYFCWKRRTKVFAQKTVCSFFLFCTERSGKAQERAYNGVFKTEIKTLTPSN